jgi:hypothetical protein
MNLVILILLLATNYISCARLKQLQQSESTVDKVLFEKTQFALSKLSPENASSELKEMFASKDDK